VTKVAQNEQGHIKTDDYQNINIENIFALGDVCLTLPFYLVFRLCGLGELLQNIIEDDSLMLRTFPLL